MSENIAHFRLSKKCILAKYCLFWQGSSFLTGRGFFLICLGSRLKLSDFLEIFQNVKIKIVTNVFCLSSIHQQAGAFHQLISRCVFSVTDTRLYTAPA